MDNHAKATSVDLDNLQGDWLEGQWSQRDALLAELRASRKVVEAAQNFIAAVDYINRRPRPEGIEMRAVAAQGALRDALEGIRE